MLGLRSILRLALVSLVAAQLASCSVIVGNRIVGRVTDCANQDDRTPCVGGDYCFAGACRYAFCGDGVVNANRGEECDDGNLLAGDGCEPVTCKHTCDGDSPCADDGNPCNGPESCLVSTHLCSSGPNAGAIACTSGGATGTCTAGLCVPPGCGDGTVVGAEQCDPPNGAGCMANCLYACTSDAQCPPSDPCVEDRHCNLGSHMCETLPAVSCEDDSPCTADGCSAGVGGCFHNPYDADSDGYSPLSDCGPTSTIRPNDCNDNDPNVHPMAIETLNNVDDDCNGLIDDNVVLVVTCYVDHDGDGYPDLGSAVSLPSCRKTDGYVGARADNLFDCADRVMSANPGVDASTYFNEPYCADNGRPTAVGGDVFTCDDQSTPSFDYNCDGLVQQSGPYTFDQACGSGCPDSGGWVGVAPPACGGIGDWSDCYSCQVGVALPRQQTCR